MPDAGPVGGASWRPEIGLVVVQGLSSDKEAQRLRALVARVTAMLNESFGEGGPHFSSFDNEKLLKSAPRSGERGREYKKEQYWTALTRSRARGSAQYVIGVCSHQLPESSFNLESRSDGVAIVTVANYEEYRPPMMSLEAFTAYLVICVAMLLQDDNIQEHEEAVGCLFDICIDPADVTPGLRKPSLTHCRERDGQPLIRWPSEVLNIYADALKDIGRKDPTALSSSAVGNRLVGAVGGVILAFFANLAVAEIPRLALCIAFAVLMCGAGFVLLRGLSRFEWVKEHRTGVFWATVTSVIAIIVAATYYTWSTGHPSLPNEHVPRVIHRVASTP